MGYVAFHKILVTELDGSGLLKTTQAYETQMKTFKIRRPK